MNSEKTRVMIFAYLKQLNPKKDEGFTIIESLIAIIVVAILLSAIAPAIILSAHTRVQARRIEQATDAVRSYVDNIRSGRIPPPNPMDTTKAGYKVTKNNEMNNVVVPQLGLGCTQAQILANNGYCQKQAVTQQYELFCVDGDSEAALQGCSTDSKRDFIIQAYSYTTAASRTPENGYLLGLRVYRADGFAQDGKPLLKAPEKQAAFGVRLGDKARKTPLFETIVEISPRDASAKDTRAFEQICNRTTPQPDPNKPICK